MNCEFASNLVGVQHCHVVESELQGAVEATVVNDVVLFERIIFKV